MTQFGSYREAIEMLKKIVHLGANPTARSGVEVAIIALEIAEASAIAKFEFECLPKDDQVNIDFQGGFEGTTEEYNKTISEHDL